MNDYKDLIERCKEICAWQDTGLLKGDALRSFASSRPYAQQHNSVSIAQAETLREVADSFIASVDRIAQLESRLEVTENAPDGIACRDMTIEMLEKRIKELEDERAEREKQRPVAWLDKSTEKRPGDTVWLPDDLKGMDTSWLVPLYAAQPVTAPVRITDEQVEHALRTNGDYESDAAYAMAKDGLLTDARAIETAVLRANGFKVDNQ